jgi:hypothetical protein
MAAGRCKGEATWIVIAESQRKNCFSRHPAWSAISVQTPQPRKFHRRWGLFVRHSFLPVSLAWDAFGDQNGMTDYATFNRDVRKYRSKDGRIEVDPVIGCIILSAPFFWEEPDWIPVPSNWSLNIVQGKTKGSF